MAEGAVAMRGMRAAADGWSVLDALAEVVLIVAPDGGVRYANGSAEEFFGVGAAQLCRGHLQDLIPVDNPLFGLVEQARAMDGRVSEYEMTLEGPRVPVQQVTLHVAPIGDADALVAVTIDPQSRARQIDRQLVHRHAARSVTAMSAMLAHEVKNPLSGIRGAAQLLEQNIGTADRELTRLICDEVDRICSLVDRFEVFSDRPMVKAGPVNIHEVLNHVRMIAENGFARGVRIVENYDPSLPPVFGDRDQLVQVFLNLVKNAAEAVPAEAGEIVLSTAYQHGIRFAVRGAGSRQRLPLMIGVQDNGEGIPEDLRQHMFDPFVSTKTQGSGLGLALVAKVVGDHGGVVEFDGKPGRTVFRVMLPMAEEAAPSVEGVR